MGDGKWKAQVNFISRCLKGQCDIAQRWSFKGKTSWMLLCLLMFFSVEKETYLNIS